MVSRFNLSTLDTYVNSNKYILPWLYRTLLWRHEYITDWNLEQNCHGNCGLCHKSGLIAIDETVTVEGHWDA